MTNLSRNTVYDNAMNSGDLTTAIQELQKDMEKSMSGSDREPHFGQGAPDESLGSSKDIYLDTSKGELYEKRNGSWSKIMDSSQTKGDPGEDGKSASVKAGTASSVPSGSEPSVTNSGTQMDAVLDFEIPKGEQGDPGRDGNDGSPGSDGSDGVGVDNITISGNTLTFHMTDNTTHEVTLPDTSGGGSGS